MKKKPIKKKTAKKPPAKTVPPPAVKVWPRHIVGWVDPSFFEEKKPLRLMSIHGAPRQVGGVAIDIPVVVMENTEGSLDPVKR